MYEKQLDQCVHLMFVACVRYVQIYYNEWWE